MTARIKKIAGAAATAFTVAFFVLAAAVLVLTIFVKAGSKGGVTWIFGHGLFQIVSGSMEPELRVGDVVIGRKADGTELAVGDNIVFKRDGMLVTHKVVRVNADGTVTTKGVANTAEDAPVPLADVVARQTGVLPGFGGVLNFLRSTAGFFLVIFLPLALLVLYESVSLAGALKRYRQEKREHAAEAEELTEEIARVRREIADRGEGGSEDGGTDE